MKTTKQRPGLRVTIYTKIFWRFFICEEITAHSTKTRIKFL